MDMRLFFRKKTPLVDDGLPWLRGGEAHPFSARRNHTATGQVSAILVRALLACLDGAVRSARAGSAGLVAVVASRSYPGASGLCALGSGSQLLLPHGAPDRVTYHAGILAVLEALLEPARASDFWQAYNALLAAYRTHGRSETIKEPLCKAADELYFWRAPSKL